GTLHFEHNKMNKVLTIDVFRNHFKNHILNEVPKDGIFKNIGVTSFIANLSICGPWVHFPPCSDPKHKSHRYLKRLFIPLGTKIFVISCVLMGFLWRFYYKQCRMISHPIEAGYQKISFQVLHLEIYLIRPTSWELVVLEKFTKVYHLDLNQRLSISMYITYGMKYLHHHFFVQIIHCDLNLGNILL
ncbi:hypothetical protein KI387_011096, partial [Taxus chinensis]